MAERPKGFFFRSLANTRGDDEAVNSQVEAEEYTEPTWLALAKPRLDEVQLTRMAISASSSAVSEA